MLKGMRRNAKHVLWPLTIAMIIAMGGYGVWYLIGPEQGAESTAGMLWGKKVSINDFLQARKAVQIFTYLTGREIIDPKILNTMVWERILLLEAAARAGITVGAGEIASLLASLPHFQTEGRFNPQRYSRIIKQWGLSNIDFEKQLEEFLITEKLRRTIQFQALVSEAEVEDFYTRFNDQVKVEYVTFLQDSFKESVEISEDALQEYYEENRGQFELPPQVEIKFILIDRKGFEEEAEVSSEEVEAYYRENQATFTDDKGEPQDLDDVEEDIEKAIVRRKADKALTARAEEINRALLDITDLETAAAKFSLPIETTGLFSAEEVIIPGLGDAPEVSRAAFRMETGEISYPVPVPDGFTFFELIQKSDARPLTFTEARDKVRERVNYIMIDQEALQLSQDELTELRRLMTEDGLTFRKAAEELDLAPTTTDLFTRKGGEELPESPAFVPASFSVPVGETSQLFRIKDGYAFLHVLERVPAGPLPEDEQEEWLNLTRQNKATTVNSEWFRNLLRESKLSVLIPELNPY